MDNKKYEYGLKELVGIPFSYLTDFLSKAHTSRKKSLRTFIVQIVNIVLIFYIGFKIIPLLLDTLSLFSKSTNISNLGSFFLMLIIVFVSSVLSEKIKLSGLFKWDFYASLAICVSLILAIISFQYYTERTKTPN